MPEKKPHRIPIEPLRWDDDDPLAPEHKLIAAFLSETLKNDRHNYWNLDIEGSELGRKIRQADGNATVRLIVALAAHANHFDALSRQVRALGATEMERNNPHAYAPEWETVWSPRQVAANILRGLMRHKLPFGREDLMKLAEWIASSDSVGEYGYPLKAFVKAVAAYGTVDPNDGQLRGSLSRVARAMKDGRDLAQLAQRIDKVIGPAADSSEPARSPSAVRDPQDDPSKPAPVGSPAVLTKVKHFLGIGQEAAAASEIVGLDRFALRADSPLREEHELISRLLPEIDKANYYEPDLSKTTPGKAMLARLRDVQAGSHLITALAERCADTYFAGGGG